MYIYEYRFAKFGHPGNKSQAPKIRLSKNCSELSFFFPLLTDWNGVTPTTNNIPAGLLQVFKDPFPIPSPAPLPPPDILYARPIPQEIQNILATVRLIASTSEDKGEGTSTQVSPPSPPASLPAPNVGSSCSFALPSTESLFAPYEPPSHYRAHVEASKARIDEQEHVAHELPQVKKMDPYEEGK
jgi:hypothetical protein